MIIVNKNKFKFLDVILKYHISNTAFILEAVFVSFHTYFERRAPQNLPAANMYEKTYFILVGNGK